MKPYVYERQVEQWTNMQLVGTLQRLGFNVSWYPLSGRLEKRLGVDAVFGSGSPELVKLFGLQYKVLWRGNPDYWPLDEAQHQILLNTRWASYCMSDMRSMKKSSMALDLARFYSPQVVDRAKTGGRKKWQLPESAGSYRRWAKFLEAVEECRSGIRVRDRDELESALRQSTPEVTDVLDSMFLLSWSAEPTTGDLIPGNAVVFDSSLAPGTDDLNPDAALE